MECCGFLLQWYWGVFLVSRVAEHMSLNAGVVHDVCVVWEALQAQGVAVAASILRHGP